MYSSSSGVSRLAQKEKKKVIRQTVTMVAVALILLLGFLFVGLPSFIRLITAFISNNAGPTDSSDMIPPRVPTISALPVATSSARLEVQGFGEPDSDMVLIVNGEEQAREKAEADGKFTLSLILKTEENVLRVFAVDSAGNESTPTKDYSVKFDTTPPILEIVEPVNGQSYELRKNQTITIKGMTEARTKVTVNDRLLFVKSDGSFSGSFQLTEGENTLKFRAVDEAGNETTVEVKANFRL